jgi:hypothetical protein
LAASLSIEGIEHNITDRKMPYTEDTERKKTRNAIPTNQWSATTDGAEAFCTVGKQATL